MGHNPTNFDGGLAINGVEITATPAEINAALDGITSTYTELNYNDITTLGTAQVSKALTLDASGNVLFPAGTAPRLAVVTGTTAAVIPNEGFVTVTSTGAKTFTLENPVANCQLFLQAIAASTAAVITITTSTSAFINGSKNSFTFNAAYESVILNGLSATNYACMNISSVTLTT